MTYFLDVIRKFEIHFNRVFFHTAALLYKHLVQSYAFIARKQIVCGSLNGHGQWDTAIASDMKVHCNCMDFYGNGALGSLKENNLNDIWYGPVAQSFRARLKKGFFPITECAKCSAWYLSPKKKANSVKLPSSIMVENTYKCNYSCISCHRKPLELTRGQSRLEVKDIETVSNTIRDNGIKKMVFHVLGEPFLVNDIDRQLQTIRDENPGLDIFLTTNGTLLNTDKKRFAATLVNRIEFSLDGIDDLTVKRYQLGGNFTLAFQNLKNLVQYSNANGAKTAIGWKYVMFRWNDSAEQIRAACELAKEAGVSYIFFRSTFTPVTGISHRTFFYKYFGLPVKGRKVERTNGGFYITFN